jgi:Flp pilus assembly protein CpaB
MGVFTAMVVGSAVGRTTAAADRLGHTRDVWVVRRAIAAGDVFETGDAVVMSRPRGLVPSGALDAASTPIGEATRVAVVPGEVVLTERLAGRGARGIAAVVPPGYRAVALPIDEAMPVVQPGDRVDVLATFDVGSAADEPGESGAPSFAVATNAEVLAVSARTITLSVIAKDAPRVAFALAKAAVTVALRGPEVASERSLSR